MKFFVVWRKDGEITSTSIQAEDAVKAYQKFVETKPGGGVPVSPNFNVDTNGDVVVTKVTNSAGRCLVQLLQIG
mgnify:FL=1